MANRRPLSAAGSIPVICDRCRAEGLAGDDPFEAFGALLDFEPVPRGANRSDGWDAEVQRAYVAALSLTGADRAACRAVGRSAFGVTQLIAHEGSEGFRAAREEALAIAADERSFRLAEGLRAVALEQAGWRPPAPPYARAASRRPPPAEPEPDEAALARREAAGLEALETLCCHYLKRLEMEREARLAGRVVEADFYVRQITAIEVWLDLASEDALKVLRDLQLRDAYGRVQMILAVETPLSRLLDEARREQWAEAGEPERPPLPPPDKLVDCGRFSMAGDSVRGGPDHKERERALKADHAAAARAQVEWEARAREESAAWRARVEAEAADAPLPDREGQGVGGGEGRSTGPEPPGDGHAPE